MEYWKKCDNAYGLDWLIDLISEIARQATGILQFWSKPQTEWRLLPPFARLQIQVAIRISDRSRLRATSCTVSRARDRSMVPEITIKACETTQEAIDFEECCWATSSPLHGYSIAWMLRPKPRIKTGQCSESTAGSSEARFNKSPFCVSRDRCSRWGFGASCGLKVREETGRLSPPQSVTAFRLSSMVIGRCVPDYI